MIIALAKGYEGGSNKILDTLIIKNWGEKQELATALEMKLRTFECRWKELQDNNECVVYKYKGNNLIVLLGIDKSLNKWEAMETAKYRACDMFDVEEDIEEVNQVELFTVDEEKKESVSSFSPPPYPKKIIMEVQYLDWVAARVVIWHDLEPIKDELEALGIDMTRWNRPIP